MIAIFTIVAPVFGIIAIGYAAGRWNLLSPNASQGISDFAFTLAIPALLCRTIATAEFGSLSPLAVWGSFYTAGFATWAAATLLARYVLRRPAEDAPAIAMTATFGNTVMLGIPLALGTYGAPASAVIALILSIHAPIWWLTGMLHAQATGGQPGQPLLSILRTLGGDLVRNPIVIGIMVGVLWRVTGLTLPAALNRLLELMAQAGIPTSLVALGLTLVRFEIKGQMPTLLSVVALKLVLMPTIAWAMATGVFGLDALTTGVIVILAAVPTGANAFLFAARIDRAVSSASGAVALGTLIAALSAAFIVSLLHG
ncbi:MAG: AEC family transporter [Hyphomicrobiaceae bacterium]|nr:AEC family transporter [Hyphomicrobiaceae bacterium]